MLCDDKICELSDASFADAWALELLKSDNIGTSLIISRNKEFENILQKLITNDFIEIRESDKNLVYCSQALSLVRKRKNAFIKIFKIFKKRTPEYDHILLNSDVGDYIYILKFFILNLILSKRNFWFFLYLYLFLFKKAAFIKSMIISKNSS